MSQGAPPMDPTNLLVRFLLEIAALAGLALGGWHLVDGWARPLLSTGLLLSAMAIWGIFRVPGDPSSKGHAPIAVGGTTRLTIEAVVFAGAVGGFFIAGHAAIGLSLACAVAIHYVVSYRRLGWLLAASK